MCSIEHGNDVSTRVQAGAIQGAITRFQAYTFVSEVACDDERLQEIEAHKARSGGNQSESSFVSCDSRTLSNMALRPLARHNPQPFSREHHTDAEQ